MGYKNVGKRNTHHRVAVADARNKLLKKESCLTTRIIEKMMLLN